MVQMLSGSRASRNTGARSLILASVASASVAATASGLNDTGQTACHDVNGTSQTCTTAFEDGRTGRDAAYVMNALPKTGSGAAGFDFSKIANNGSVLAVNAALGSGASDWACTRDNVTGLTWEVKTANLGDLRYDYNGYTWYSTAANNGGDPGAPGYDYCNGTLSAYGNQCNTTNYLLAVNAATLCGHADWRLPTRMELQGIKSFAPGDPAIDTTFFPNTASSGYWTSDSYVSANNAWTINFAGDFSGNISTSVADKSSGAFILAVRGP